MRVRLTKARVLGINPGPKDLFLWDSELPGFGLKITPSGRQVFIVQYRPFGGRRSVTRRVTLGTFGELSVEEARRFARVTLGSVAHGVDPAAERTAGRLAETVGEAVAIWLDELAAKRKPRTVYEWRRIWQRELLPVLASHRVREVSAEQIARLHLLMRGRPIMANRALGAAGAFFAWCERRGLRQKASNPARSVDRYRERERERYLTPEELRRLSETLRRAETTGIPSALKLRRRLQSPDTAKYRPKSSGQPRIADSFAVAAIRFLALSGMREQEALSLRWDAIDFARGIVTLEETKNGRSVRPLGAAALAVLAGLPRVAQNPFVFPGAQAGGHRIEVRRIWEAVREAASLDGVRLHDLRHTVASYAVSGGASMPVIAAILGHRDLKSTQRYAHLLEDARRHAANRAAGDILAAMDGSSLSVTALRSTA